VLPWLGDRQDICPIKIMPLIPKRTSEGRKLGGDLLTQVYLKSSSYNGDVFLE